MRHQPIWKKNNRQIACLVVLGLVLICAIWIHHHVRQTALHAIQPTSMNLDIVLLLASAALTVSIAWVGIEMANNPPTSARAKRNYRIGFVVIAGMLMTVTYWQGKRNKAEQDAIRSDATQEIKNIQSQYDQLIGKVNTIDQFVEHPPAGLTKAEVAEVVRAQVTDALRTTIVNRNQSSESGPATVPGPAVVATPAPNVPLTQNSQALKAQGLQLAKEIDDWIASVSKDAPKVTNPTPGTEDARNTDAYLDRLNKEWMQNFFVRANSMVNELHVTGLLIACRSITSYRPSMVLEFRRTCADHIEDAAKRLQ
jgi:predicted negative regulator of RcsB-dependent stress response